MKTTTTTLKRSGLMLVLSSPSGAGKTSISRAILEHDNHISLSISATTRPRRPSEIANKDYIFKDTATFKKQVSQDYFLEHAEVFGHYYGTPNQQVEDILASGRDVLFDIDWQGTQQIKAKRRKDMISIFVLPPSTAELERRLLKRAQDSHDSVAARMAKAEDEMSHYHEYDYIIVNNDLAESVAAVQHILQAERMRVKRQLQLADFVQQLRRNHP